MTDRRFDDRVAVVTGAGRGLGRAYARMLAAHGARVVVNDLGSSTDGAGADNGPAHDAVAEIREAGGTAIADTSDIATAEGAATAVSAAIDTWGRIDILVNNAGIVRYAGMGDADASTIKDHLDVHVMGSFNTSNAAWPHMVEQNYGRIVHTGSIGMFGLPDNLGYAIAKSAMMGMARAMTLSAGDKDITTNVILPNAMTRMGGAPSDGMDSLRESARVPTGMEPDLVAPMVGLLSHESCPVSGEIFLAGGGRFAHLFVGVTEGYLHPSPANATIDDIATALGQITDQSDFHVPTSLMECVGRYMSHRRAASSDSTNG